MDNKKELLFSITKKDFRVDYYRASGKGGQKVNKTSSACRITHIPSGAVAQCQSSRIQQENKRVAFERLLRTDTFKKWYKIECSKHLGQYQDAEEIVNDMMNPRNLKIETLDDLN